MRAARLLVNWTVVLTSPVWVLPAFLTVIGYSALKRQEQHREHFEAFLSGETWLL